MNSNMRFIKYIAVSLLFMVSFHAIAQQTPMYSQYMFNDFVINPAVASTYDYYQIRSTNRFQWVGIKDAPVTNVLSVYGPNKTGPWGWGASVYSDNQGPTGKTGGYLSYAYYIKVYKDYKLSFGLNIGFVQFKIDESKITFANPEPTAISHVYSEPDATAGLYLYNSKSFFGISVDQLFQNNLAISYNVV